MSAAAIHGANVIDDAVQVPVVSLLTAIELQVSDWQASHPDSHRDANRTVVKVHT